MLLSQVVICQALPLMDAFHILFAHLPDRQKGTHGSAKCFRSDVSIYRGLCSSLTRAVLPHGGNQIVTEVPRKVVAEVSRIRNL